MRLLSYQRKKIKQINILNMNIEITGQCDFNTKVEGLYSGVVTSHTQRSHMSLSQDLSLSDNKKF